MKPYVLIVEDEAILYDRLSQALLKEHFEVSDYTKSYDEAIESIAQKRPDIALLDINLQGKKDGLDLGNILHKKYNIPFIYITDLDDDRIFSKGLQTNHEHFMVKTKPTLNTKEVVRVIDTVLNRQKQKPSEKEYLLALTDTHHNTKSAKEDFISKRAIAYKDILCFTSDNWKDKNGKEHFLEKHYCHVITKSNEILLVKKSLIKLTKIIPNYFLRISDCYVVNISPNFLKGRINGNRLMISEKEYTISPTYKKEVEKRFKQLYDRPI